MHVIPPRLFDQTFPPALVRQVASSHPPFHEVFFSAHQNEPTFVHIEHLNLCIVQYVVIAEWRLPLRAKAKTGAVLEVWVQHERDVSRLKVLDRLPFARPCLIGTLSARRGACHTPLPLAGQLDAKSAAGTPAGAGLQENCTHAEDTYVAAGRWTSADFLPSDFCCVEDWI